MSDVISPGPGEENVPSRPIAGEGLPETEPARPVTDATDPQTAPATQTTLAEVEHTDWRAIERDSDFRELVRQKRNFIIPASIFFVVYYFGFLILVGYNPELVDTNVIGNINVAYLFALSQFIVAWIIVALYVWRAGFFDRLAERIVAKVKGVTRYE